MDTNLQLAILSAIKGGKEILKVYAEDIVVEFKSDKSPLTKADKNAHLAIVEGLKNIYPRLAPTMEWDTAAGHAIAYYSDCKVYNYETGSELKYNKENMLNPWFVVWGNNKGMQIKYT